NQIADNVTVFIKPGGLLDLNGNNDVIGGLNMTGGRVVTGAGVLTLGGDGTVNNSSNQSSAISGRLYLGSAPRTFTINDGHRALIIDAVISGGSAASLIKNGLGDLVLEGANTFDGQVIVNNGFLDVLNTSSALGSTVGDTVVNAGASLAVGQVNDQVTTV